MPKHEHQAYMYSILPLITVKEEPAGTLPSLGAEERRLQRLLDQINENEMSVISACV